MFTSQQLRQQLSSIHQKSYPAYKTLKGIYDFKHFLLSIDHVQGDPFASPSHLSIQVPAKIAAFPAFCFSAKNIRIAVQDYILRKFSQQLSIYNFKAKGSGKSGSISTSVCGQKVLERTACEISSDFVTVRFTVGFPANGRTINAFELEKILFEFLPSCVEKSLLYKNLSPKAVESVVFLAEDQEFLRQELKKHQLVAFVANHSILPRESGISQKPMKNAVPFQSPASLETEFTLPHRGKIKGMAIPQGITLIAGGGYHGKSTLLTALEDGVYNHIAGDGREFVLTDSSAVKLRAEDGRFIKDVDISLFINDLPNGKDTHCFSTLDASGSTSQAAGIVEGMEAGSTLFLLDEDTSATNFMVRDGFMQQVISRDKEPITPFLERAPQLFSKAGISTILVAGSSGAFFHIADTVIQMDRYQALDITEKVKKLCSDYPLPPSSVPSFYMPSSKRVMSSTKKASYKDFKIKCHGKDSFSIGKDTVDLRYIEQLTDKEQTAALGELLRYAQEYLVDGKRTISEIISVLQNKIEKDGFSAFFGNSYIPYDLAVPRIQEIFSCFNRYRRP
mgnify:FL=1